MVHRVIYDELCRGVVQESSRDAYLEVLARLVRCSRPPVSTSPLRSMPPSSEPRETP
ncbi:MAG: hypothetical protein KDB63_12265 [Nocardioidaceae bacterium]|nr:hypothetical protein [Nocardioidaceae bacterium]